MAGCPKPRTSDVSHASYSRPGVPPWITEVKATATRGEEEGTTCGRHRRPAAVPRDNGRAQLSEPPGPADTRPILALDRIRTTGGANEYTEGPTAAQRSSASDVEPADAAAPSTQNGNASGSPSGVDGAVQPAGGEDSGIGASPGQRLLQVVRAQPKQHSEELKPLGGGGGGGGPAEGGGEAAKPEGVHTKCEDCGRCRCRECRQPRALPSCWLCGRRCVCSAQTAAEYGTCVCCVKGLFYHCSSDDEDTCADKPFSCAPPRRCARWAAASLLALLFPCVLCYLPAKGCVAACQSCYDRVTRPGCRC
ncbi:protein sprouty homolog 2 [Nelusetta ayraudi]|uniref:protein sprouty homolog 2 n=1 Tax=Nelusetta ayraudi TaxID=303726 RepID=UPI003F72A632